MEKCVYSDDKTFFKSGKLLKRSLTLPTRETTLEEAATRIKNEAENMLGWFNAILWQLIEVNSRSCF